MKTIGELSFLPVWVNPSHRVATVKVLLAGHRLKAIGVIEGGKFLGTIGYEEIAAASDSDEVAPFLRPLDAYADPSETTRTVADLLARHELDYIPVLEAGRFLGIVTATMLLQDMGRSYDPLTHLSWSDGLRDWGIERLKEGRELTILFLDLDEFGSYNKKFGHIVGDRVLVRVAAYLRGAVDPATDVLCRYGGDEFAIGTIRTRRETEELLAILERGLQGTLIAETDQPVSFSAGIFGGRRTKERENVHYHATLDTLINMASKEAMAAKTAKKEPPPTAVVRAEWPSVSVVEVFSSGDSPSALTTVILSAEGRVASGVHTRGEATKSQSAVLAAAKAIERLLPGTRFEMGDVQLSEDDKGSRFVTVNGFAGTGEGLASVSATCTVGPDLYRSAVEALVEALASTSG